MAQVSTYRTKEQQAAAVATAAKGFAHDRDSAYKATIRGQQIWVALVVLFGWERYALVYPDGSVETKERKARGSKTVTFNRDKLLACAGKLLGTTAPTIAAPAFTRPSRPRGGYREPSVTRGADAPLPEKRPDVLAKMVARLNKDGAFLQHYSNGEFTISSLVLARTYEDAVRVPVLEVPGYTVHFDAANKVFWRQGGSFD